MIFLCFAKITPLPKYEHITRRFPGLALGDFYRADADTLAKSRYNPRYVTDAADDDKILERTGVRSGLMKPNTTSNSMSYPKHVRIANVLGMFWGQTP